MLLTNTLFRINHQLKLYLLKITMLLTEYNLDFGTSYPINPFVPNVPFLCPWKHQSVSRFSDVFRGERKGALGTSGLSIKLFILPKINIYQGLLITGYKRCYDTYIYTEKLSHGIELCAKYIMYLLGLTENLDLKRKFYISFRLFSTRWLQNWHFSEDTGC